FANELLFALSDVGHVSGGRRAEARKSNHIRIRCHFGVKRRRVRRWRPETTVVEKPEGWFRWFDEDEKKSL
ncbi:hypothetical protein M8C21_021125, partial [Ambrosia artemisiifolia]